jgi:UDP-N-acetylmuramoylalanine--D-glutamate ligase
MDDATCVGLGQNLKPQVYWFSRKTEVERGASVRGGKIVFRDAKGEREIMPVDEITLKGAHNLENVLAAVAMGSLAGVEPAKIRQAVKDFKAVEHRLEYTATIHGVQYFNDSKATNVDATIKALESFPGKIHLILGGKDKGSDYSVLNDLLKSRVKRVYTIGAAAQKIESQIGGAAEITSAGTLDAAVRKASDFARSGDIVLLAPACASFDQFQSYEHRGRAFKEAVHALAARETSNVGGQ